MSRARTDLLVGCLAITMLSATAIAQSLPFERTEEREHCDNHDTLRRPLFGDLHVHTSYSFDSYISSQRNDPDAAYRYAKGEAIALPDEDGNPTIVARIQRPLDFTSVTDHSEYLGQINVCTTDASRLGYWWPHCVDDARVQPTGPSCSRRAGGPRCRVDGRRRAAPRSFACTLSDCDGRRRRRVEAASRRPPSAHYDRSSALLLHQLRRVRVHRCARGDFNLHRNVIFRNEQRNEAMPISTYDTGAYNFPELWNLSCAQECIEAGTGCDVLAIPHNPESLAGGLMFRDPETPEEATERRLLRARRRAGAAQGQPRSVASTGWRAEASPPRTSYATSSRWWPTT